MKMHIMSPTEWERLKCLADCDDDRMHWKEIMTWLSIKKQMEDGCKPTAGSWGGKESKSWRPQNRRAFFIGFRPTIVNDALPACSSRGQPIVIGTLYMDEEPVRVPQWPWQSGDIAHYKPGASLRMGPALDDPLYMVQGIQDDKKVYADRCLLVNISYNDIITALQSPRKASAKKVRL